MVVDQKQLEPGDTRAKDVHRTDRGAGGVGKGKGVDENGKGNPTGRCQNLYRSWTVEVSANCSGMSIKSCLDHPNPNGSSVTTDRLTVKAK